MRLRCRDLVFRRIVQGEAETHLVCLNCVINHANLQDAGVLMPITQRLEGECGADRNNPQPVLGGIHVGAIQGGVEHTHRSIQRGAVDIVIDASAGLPRSVGSQKARERQNRLARCQKRHRQLE